MKRKSLLDDTQPVKRIGIVKDKSPPPKPRKPNRLALMLVILFFAGVVVFTIYDVRPPPPKFVPRATSAQDCQVFISSDRGRFDFTLIIAGKNQERAYVDIYLPNKSRPAEVNKRYRRTFSDTGEPYILQSYSTYDWKGGSYRLNWTVGSKTGKRDLYLNDADNRVDVYCD